jgi:hypothetical protein
VVFENILVRYLLHDPLHLLSVRTALAENVYPPRLAAAVRTLIVATERQAVADPKLIQDVDECALPLLPPRRRRAALRHM